MGLLEWFYLHSSNPVNPNNQIEFAISNWKQKAPIHTVISEEGSRRRLAGGTAPAQLSACCSSVTLYPRYSLCSKHAALLFALTKGNRSLCIFRIMLYLEKKKKLFIFLNPELVFLCLTVEYIVLTCTSHGSLTLCFSIVSLNCQEFLVLYV